MKRLPDKTKKSLYEKPLFKNYLRGYGEDYYMRGQSFAAKIIYSKNIKYKVPDLINEGKHDRLINFINSNSNEDANYLKYLLNKEIKKIFFTGDIHTSMKLFDIYIKSLNAVQPNIFFRAGINAYRASWLLKN